uniref:non-specific serine/threonine protein kinase n=1 Tax=Caenorhabditis tropicalis TaxID=1561998 RepID=A0A1I7ULD5_9PELO
MITNPNRRATSAQNRYERIRTVGKEEGVLMIEMEYADGGTLAQLLARSQNLLEEEQIVDMMIQMCSAVAYLHENSVLHRDLKTANVFLTRDSFVKIGDFGISKIMGTETLAQGAKTVVGTPYYISPEMCSGVSYNEKSDMWALGCILYEMCCLKKAFEGDNLPALVNSIMTCAYTPVKGPYSSETKMVIRELLQLDPQNRPSAPQALKMLRPSENRHRHTSGSMRSSVSFTTLYDLHVPTITLSSIPDLPSRISVKQISLSKTHTMVLTNDNELFGFGDNSCGQLGFGTFSKVESGKLVESLKGRDIQSIGVGNYFSVVCCDRGTLMTIGTAKNLGLGKEAKDSSKPVLLEQLLRENIKEIYCGHDHVIAILENGECLGWGSNQYGQLGLPTLEHFFNPTKILMPNNKKIVYGKAGKDATMLLSEDGSLIAMGSNKHNKLNLTHRVGFFAKEKKKILNARAK